MSRLLHTSHLDAAAINARRCCAVIRSKVRIINNTGFQLVGQLVAGLLTQCNDVICSIQCNASCLVVSGFPSCLILFCSITGHTRPRCFRSGDVGCTGQRLISSPIFGVAPGNMLVQTTQVAAATSKNCLLRIIRVHNHSIP